MLAADGCNSPSCDSCRQAETAEAACFRDNVNMTSLRSRYTLLVPTFNRSAHLRNLLGYLAARRFEYPVRVLDSSSADALSHNRETVGRGGLDVVHEVYDPATPVHKKIELAMGSVESHVLLPLRG